MKIFGTVNKFEIVVEFSDAVLDHFSRHRQTHTSMSEAGGQMFALITNEGRYWDVVHVSGPRPMDQRSRFGVCFNREVEQSEIDAAFEEGLHYVGDWHTHPEPAPNPSRRDFLSMQQIARDSQHQLPGFLMIIVGDAALPASLWVSFHSREGGHVKLQSLQTEKVAYELCRCPKRK